MAKKTENEQDLINKVAFGLYILSEVSKKTGFEKPTRSQLKESYGDTEDKHKQFSLFFDLQNDKLKKSEIGFLADCARRYSIKFQNLRDFKSSEFYTDFCQEAKNYLDNLSLKFRNVDKSNNSIEKENRYSRAFEINKKVWSDSQTIEDLLKHILKVEQEIAELEKLNVHSYEHKRLVEKKQNEKKYCIDFLIEKIESKPYIVTPDFLILLSENFTYEWSNLLSLNSCNDLLPLVKSDVIFKVFKGEDEYAVANLGINLLKVSWAKGLIEIALQAFEISRSKIDTLYKDNKIDTFTYQSAMATILDYGCGFDVGLTKEYRNLGDDYKGTYIEKLDLMATTRQCSACRYIRSNELTEAKKWLEEAKEIILKFQIDLKQLVNGRWFYFYFIESAYLLKNNNYENAKISAEKAINYFHRTSLSGDLLEVAFVYYILYKVNSVLDEQNAIKYAYKAYKVLSQSVRRNYCLFDFNEVLADLEKGMCEE